MANYNSTFNQVLLVGNVGQDPDINITAGGQPVANLNVATTIRVKDRQTGEPKDYTEWHRLSAFGQMAENIAKYVKKGTSIFITGRLVYRKYTDEAGVERIATNVQIDSWSLHPRGSVNLIVLSGNLGDDPELRTIPGTERQVVNFSMATTDSWKDKVSGERIERTEWHRVTAFDRNAETIAKYVKKGNPLWVQGRITYREYEKEGVKHYVTEIVVENVQLLKRTNAPSNDAPNGGDEVPGQPDEEKFFDPSQH